MSHQLACEWQHRHLYRAHHSKMRLDLWQAVHFIRPPGARYLQKKIQWFCYRLTVEILSAQILGIHMAFSPMHQAFADTRSARAVETAPIRTVENMERKQWQNCRSRELDLWFVTRVKCAALRFSNLAFLFLSKNWSYPFFRIDSVSHDFAMSSLTFWALLFKFRSCPNLFLMWCLVQKLQAAMPDPALPKWKFGMSLLVNGYELM